MALELVAEILLPRLLAASVQSALFVAGVWALCRCLPRLSATARAGLWWLVALQLVVGVAWSSPLALPLLPAEVVAQVRVVPVQVALSASQSTQWSAPTALAWMWLLGLAFMVARTLRGYLATRRLLEQSRPCQDVVVLGALRLAAEAHGLRAPPQLRLSAAIDSPQLIGPWQPVLLLPANPSHSMHADELDMALTHELVHLRRGDLWFGLLPAIAQHLFFFHPLAHFAAHEYALAREAACDAAVIAGNRHCAHDYGRLLVRLGVAPRPSAGLASASPTFRVLKRRLVMLQNTASTPRIVALLITVAVAALGVVPYRLVAAPQESIAPVAGTPVPATYVDPVTEPGEPTAPVAPVARVAHAAGAAAPVAHVDPVTVAAKPVEAVAPPAPPTPPLPAAPPPPPAAAAPPAPAVPASPPPPKAEPIH